jgi:hypothetical protein
MRAIQQNKLLGGKEAATTGMGSHAKVRSICMNLEHNVKSFLKAVDLKHNPRAWSGLIATLRRKSGERIHGRCAVEMVRSGLTTTEWFKASGGAWKFDSRTSLHPDARSEIVRQLGVEGLHH